MHSKSDSTAARTSKTSARQQNECRVRLWLRIAHAPGAPHRLKMALASALERCAGEDIDQLDLSSLMERVVVDRPNVDIQALSRWCDSAESFCVDDDLRWLAHVDHHMITLEDDGYPPLLRTLSEPPIVLYVNGDPASLTLAQIAIVGSRAATPNGLVHGRAYAQHLARSGLGITSGLARGIDGAAHQGALDVNGITVALMATGPDRIYPARHLQLAKDIVEAGGALVSEFACGSPPRKHHFARRNRLISGLCVATLVVEAAMRSGSLITARLAAEQGRDVFALPGPPGVTQYQGCHALIRDGAILLDAPEQLVAEFGWFSPPVEPSTSTSPRDRDTAYREKAGSSTRASGNALHQRVQGRNFESMVRPSEAVKTADQRGRPDPEGFVEKSRTKHGVVEHIGFTPIAIDELVKVTGLTAPEVCAIVTTLEVEGIVHTTPGGSVVRNTRPGDII